MEGIQGTQVKLLKQLNIAIKNNYSTTVQNKIENQLVIIRNQLQNYK